MPSKLLALEEKQLAEDDHNEVPPSDIVSYNELRSCADLLRMHQQKILQIMPDFQRDVVWQGSDQTRFIDSLIKQLPIPSMCFAMDYKKQEWMVIDGLQRIATIVKFLKGEDWKLSTLDDIDQAIAGKSAAALKNDDGELHKYFTRVENHSLPINVLRCDFSKRDHLEYLFTIFHRLNTGGLKLNNQEIRNCIYGGSLNTLLQDLDKTQKWRRINRMKGTGRYRFVKQELALRFFAFMDQRNKYRGQVAKFLNDYMHEHRNADETFIANKRRLFERTVSCINDKIFSDASPPAMPLTIMEAVLVGVASNIDLLDELDGNDVSRRYDALMNHDRFSEDELAEGLSKKPKVDERLDTAIRIFAGQP